MNIEELARQLFEYYGLRETGIRPNWQYLKKERQLAWVEDVHLVADVLLSQLKEKVKPLGTNQNLVQTSYAMGYNEGVKSERVLMINLVEQIEQEVEDQIFLFKEGMD
jgi:hypothetical protein